MLKVKYLQDYQIEINNMITDIRFLRDHKTYSQHHKIEYQVKRIKDCINYITELNNK